MRASFCVTHAHYNAGVYLIAIDKIDSLSVLLDCTSVARHALSGRMSTNTAQVALLYLFILFFGSGFSQTDYAQYVNPLIGSEGPILGLAFGGG